MIKRSECRKRSMNLTIKRKVKYNLDLNQTNRLKIWMKYLMRKSQTKSLIAKRNPSNLNLPSKENLFKIFRLQLIDIKNIRLQNIYNDDMEELRKNIALGKQILEPKTFKFEILVCFWVTIHLQKLEFVKYIYE